jgi:hypothetical protein
MRFRLILGLFMLSRRREPAPPSDSREISRERGKCEDGRERHADENERECDGGDGKWRQGANHAASHAQNGCGDEGDYRRTQPPNDAFDRRYLAIGGVVRTAIRTRAKRIDRQP